MRCNTFWGENVTHFSRKITHFGEIVFRILCYFLATKWACFVDKWINITQITLFSYTGYILVPFKSFLVSMPISGI